jgi:t-SNARE complex subunit (syntaxin)
MDERGRTNEIAMDIEWNRMELNEVKRMATAMALQSNLHPQALQRWHAEKKKKILVLHVIIIIIILFFFF